MKTTFTRSLLILTLAASMAGCAGMSQKQKNAAVGAAIGGIAGSVLTNGGTLGTVGGAAIGGAIGHGVK
ncbi:glycine zipper 2TM domain-containing protein [Craterilacuibacter sp. RT1T]|uniref:glycine zipper 2TM domain-containing protein n=1 Tax=Craterilacuibacter sp. RT1T TaxID=2942211 RepID=UPI0020C03879|nr:glycine zipper 2TM domain-containing protein [Craterilacuibacter sp. RT1T]MCL6262644.1 glycine zipper 2TM domain-containing protein [Craterilacuibacter sp. RT1T]